MSVQQSRLDRMNGPNELDSHAEALAEHGDALARVMPRPVLPRQASRVLAELKYAYGWTAQTALMRLAVSGEATLHQHGARLTGEGEDPQQALRAAIVLITQAAEKAGEIAELLDAAHDSIAAIGHTST